jgi:hypothetical protein
MSGNPLNLIPAGNLTQTNATTPPASAEVMQLLSQLRDIHTPSPIDGWPPAIGWWLLLVVIGLSLLGLLYFIRQQLQARRWNRLVAAEIRAIECLDTPAQKAAAINRLLKRLIRVRQPQEPVSALQGTGWVDYLYTRYDARHTRDGETPQTLDLSPLAEAGYQPSANFDAPALLNDVKKWIRKCC